MRNKIFEEKEPVVLTSPPISPSPFYGEGFTLKGIKGGEV